VTDPVSHAPVSGEGGPTVEMASVQVPADPAFLTVVRTCTAALAARRDFTLDDIEDLRIAVDEAAAMLLTDAVPGSDLTVTFELLEDAVRVHVATRTLDGSGPDQETFAWTVLQALTDDLAAGSEGDLVTVMLLKRRADALAA